MTKVSKGQSVQRTKYPEDKVFSVHAAFLEDKVSREQSVLRTKYQKDKMFKGQIFLRTKCSKDKIFWGQSIKRTECPRTKFPGTKIPWYKIWKRKCQQKISLGKYSYSTWFCRKWKCFSKWNSRKGKLMKRNQFSCFCDILKGIFFGREILCKPHLIIML